MTTQKQRNTARENIKKAQAAWKAMSPRQRSRAQPEGRERTKPGAAGEGNYYRIVVRDKYQFTSFRYHDVGEPGKIQRLAGRRSSGSWDDQAWLIEKHLAHVEGDTLVADGPEAKEILKEYGPVKHVKGDIFQGHPRRNVPEQEKTTAEQKRAARANLKKAGAAKQG